MRVKFNMSKSALGKTVKYMNRPGSHQVGDYDVWLDFLYAGCFAIWSVPLISSADQWPLPVHAHTRVRGGVDESKSSHPKLLIQTWGNKNCNQTTFCWIWESVPQWRLEKAALRK
jgi:hypothetical protein